MSCLFKRPSYSFIDHSGMTWITPSVSTSLAHQMDQHLTTSPDTNTSFSKPCSEWAWKKDLFAVYSPFMMDSQNERMKREKNGVVATSAQKKRQKKKGSVKSVQEQKVAEIIESVLPELVDEAKQHNHLSMIPSMDCDNNKTARDAALMPGPSDLFQHLCENFDSKTQSCERSFDPFKGEVLIHYDNQRLRGDSIIGRCVAHPAPLAKWIKIDHHQFLIPPNSVFLTSSYSYLVSQGYLQIQVDGGYDLIVLDPPWSNKSVKRKRSYWTLEETDLVNLPLAELASDQCLLCIWVPPNERLMAFVKDELFPKWGVCWLADWIWLKLTQCGQPVHDLSSSGKKKNYEYVVIGRILKPCIPGPCEESEGGSITDITGGVSTEYTSNHLAEKQNSSVPIDSSRQILDNFRQDFSGDQSPNQLSLCHCSQDQDMTTKQSFMKNLPTTQDSTNQISRCPRTNSVSSHSSSSTDTDSNVKETVSNPRLRDVSQLTSEKMPSNFLFASVPCALHSKKPPLTELVREYLSGEPKCLELFARNLQANWTSWGNEPLRHQHKDYYEQVHLDR